MPLKIYSGVHLSVMNLFHSFASSAFLSYKLMQLFPLSTHRAAIFKVLPQTPISFTLVQICSPYMQQWLPTMVGLG